MFAIVLCAVAPAPASSEASLRTTVIAELDFPTAMAPTASGDRLLVNERAGRVRVIRNGELQARAFATVDTTTAGEGGLLGLALDPRFEDGDPWIYVFYTLPGGAADRVERIHEDGRREVLMRSLPSSSRYHHGGILAFGPDGTLYVTNGEAHDPGRAQRARLLGGKIYRIERDGSVPADNPFPGSPVWSYGHRNPFGLTFDPQTGRLWESENGPENHDEVNLIRKAGNYGWPTVRGNARDRRFIDPVVDYERIVVPTGLAFAPASFGEDFRDVLFLGTFGEQTLRALHLDATRTRLVRDRIALHVQGGIVALAAGPDAIYASTPDEVIRIRSTAKVEPSNTPTQTSSPAATTTTTPGARGLGKALIGLLVISLAAAAAYGIPRWIRRRR